MKRNIRNCPNCRHGTLEEVFGELVCMHCEYHTHGRSGAGKHKHRKASFR